MSDDGQVAQAIRRTLERHGHLDVIHNNAGIASPSAPLHETSDEEWDALLNINLRSVLHTTRHGLEALKASRGCILNTSSMVGMMDQDPHLREHFVHPARIENGVYLTAQEPGAGTDLKA